MRSQLPWLHATLDRMRGNQAQKLFVWEGWSRRSFLSIDSWHVTRGLSMLFSMTKTSHPSRPGYMSSVDDRLEVTMAGGCEMYSAMGLGFGIGSV